MKAHFLKILVLIVVTLFCLRCSNGSSTTVAGGSYSGQVCTTGGTANSANVNSKTLTIGGSDANAVAITVGCGYTNMPCVSVTICAPGSGGTANCQTIPNLLLDTGSYGLRIFDNATTNSGTLSTASLGAGASLVECVSYLDGSYQWGKVMTADVVLGTKVAGSVPIHIVEASPTTETPNVPTACLNQQGFAGTADQSKPGTYNGILGVGLFAEDCGSVCATRTNNAQYFTCSGNTCTESTASLANQVINPVALMPTNYNNGIAIQLANVADAGASSSTGYMVLGIGTVSNNTPPSGVLTYQANSRGNFDTTFGGQTYTDSFIDSGSNGLFFPDSCLAADGRGFFTPSSETGFTAIQSSHTGANATSINFNSQDQDGNGNVVFNNLAGDMAGAFDWGLPFFLGRTVYVGISGSTSGLGTGPYWGY